jgi:uncharacterized repeat protein (TIGR01451 family)
MNKTAIIIAFLVLIILIPQTQFAGETLCYTQRITDAASFNLYTGKDDPNNPIVWTHTVPAGILDTVVRVGLYIEAWDVDYPPDGDEYDRVYFNGHDLGYLQGSNDSWFTVEKTVPVSAIKEGINNLEIYIDELGKDWKVTIRASELRFYCSGSDPDFSIGATPSSKEITQGQSTDYTVNLTGLNGFNSPVTLSVSGLPTGAVGVFTVNPLTPSPTATTSLSVTTTSSTPAGTYIVTIRGENGGKSHDTEVTLTIKPDDSGTEADFKIQVNPQTRNIYPGEDAGFTIKLTSENGFDTETALTIDGLPEGATASFQHASITPSASTTCRIKTSSETPLGKYTITFTAEGGDKSHSAEITLNVRERPPDPDFTLNVEPASLAIYPEETASFTVNVAALNDFSKAVTFSVTGLPTEVSASFTKESLTPDGSTALNISTNVNTPVGDYTLTITAKGGGLEHSATVVLTIQCHDFNVDIKANKVSGSAPLTVQFEPRINLARKATKVASEYTYAWTFGDGETSDLEEPEHIYQNPGRYTAKLTVTDGCGTSKSATKTIEVDAFEGAITKTFNQTEAQPGDTVTFTINARNETRVDFNNIIIRDTLSPMLEYVSDSASVAVQRSGQQLQWQFPQLTKGAHFTFTVTLKISDNAPGGAIINTAYLWHQSLGSGNGIASNTASITINKLDVSLQKQVEETSVKPAGKVKYQITIKNKSAVALSQLKLSDVLDNGLEYLSQTNSAGLTFARNGSTLEWSGILEANSTAVIILNSQVRHNVLAGTRIENTAKLEALKLKEPITSNTAVTTVFSDPVSTGSVQFTKRAEVPQSEIGRIVRFNITVANRSNATLVAPVLEDLLPQGFSYVPSSCLLNNRNFTEPQGSRRLMWQLPEIRAGETFVLRYQLVIGADTRRGRNVNRAILRATDTSGQHLSYEASAFVNVSTVGLVFFSGVEGTVYLDRDFDEFYSMTDTPLEGIEVRMSNGQKAVTDMMGNYRFENLMPGEYAVGINTATLPERYRLSAPVPKAVVLSDGLTDTADFAIRFQGEDTVGTAKLQGRVYYDKNSNKVFDGDDPPAENFKVKLNNEKITMGAKGRFVFTHLKPGAYTLTIQYGPKTIQKTITLVAGKNHIDIPLKFTGIKIIVAGEGK